MSGHSHSKTIKHEKNATDQNRGRLFSKLLNAVAIAAREEPNPQFNPRLRTTIEKARQNNVPQENIERAVKRASEDKTLEELIIGAYGPEGVAVLVEAITDNKNRTIPEIKKILSDHDAKFTEPESVLWAFENKDGQWQAKFKQPVSEESKNKINELIETLEEQDDVQKIITNSN
ncbi:MAG: YebC/PmpR family DNA-binding transcriptional regulator [bacterium]|nr:YebC/PmpR family DNA-binding transcriptional regulator [bacterium]